MNTIALLVVGFAIGFFAGLKMRRRFGYAPPRTYVFGLGSTRIETESSFIVTGKPNVRFAPDRLLIAPKSTDGVLIEDVRVGDESVLQSVGAVPVSAFAPGVGIPLKAVVVLPGTFVTVKGRNMNPHPVDFQGGLVGPA